MLAVPHLLLTRQVVKPRPIDGQIPHTMTPIPVYPFLHLPPGVDPTVKQRSSAGQASVKPGSTSQGGEGGEDPDPGVESAR